MFSLTDWNKCLLLVLLSKFLYFAHLHNSSHMHAAQRYGNQMTTKSVKCTVLQVIIIYSPEFMRVLTEQQKNNKIYEGYAMKLIAYAFFLLFFFF